jgi:hypothetical protein
MSGITYGSSYGPFALKDSLYGVIWAVEIGDKVTVSCTGDFAKIELYPTNSHTGLVDVYLAIRSRSARKITGGDYIRFMSNTAFWKEEEITFFAEDAISMKNPFEAVSLSFDNFFNTVTLAYGYKGAKYLDNIVRHCEYEVFSKR